MTRIDLEVNSHVDNNRRDRYSELYRDKEDTRILTSVMTLIVILSARDYYSRIMTLQKR